MQPSNYGCRPVADLRCRLATKRAFARVRAEFQAQSLKGHGTLHYCIEEYQLEEHAVIVNFDYGSTDLGALFEVETRLEEAIAAADVGDYDGNEIAVDGSDGTLFMYGPDADALFAAVRETLLKSACLSNVRVSLQYGPVDDDDVRRIEFALKE